MQTNANPLAVGSLEETRLKIKAARLDFAATIGTLDTWIAVYETNAAVKPQITALLDATLVSSSNFVWLVNYIKSN